MYAHRMADEMKRVTLNLIPKASEDLDWLTGELRINNTDIINRAIQLYAFLEREQREGGAKLQLGYGSGRVREVLML